VANNKELYFTAYQKHKKAGKSSAEARKLAIKESGTDPSAMTGNDRRQAIATTKREIAEMKAKPAKTWVPKLKAQVKEEFKSLRQQEDEMARRNMSEADYLKFKRR
jgi:hypothetical protein